MANQLNVVEVTRQDFHGTIKMVSVVAALAKHHSTPTSMNAAQMAPSKALVNVAREHHHHQINVHV